MAANNKHQLLKNFVAGVLGGLLVLIAGIAIMFQTGYLGPSRNGARDSDTAAPAENTPTTEDNTVVTNENKGSSNSNIATVFNSSKDAVVSVINLQKSHNDNPFFNNTDDNDNSEDGETGDLQTSSEGSGVIYKKDDDKAYIVTNNHVISGSDAVKVLLSDGTNIDAKVVGSDEWTDLAVLEIPSDNITTVAEFADSDEVKVGQVAIAIGSPLGLDYATSVTSGIISGVDRPVDVDIDGDGTVDWTSTVIQTDAAINPGNSGGALLNDAGQVVGINSMKISSATVEGMGFAIPSNEVVKIAAELEKDGEVKRPVLGVSMVNVNELSQSNLSQLNIPSDVKSGVIIGQVVSGSNAEKAGLKEYDIITKYNDTEVTDTVSLRKALYSSSIGDKVTLTIIRDGKEQTVDVTMDEAMS
ncbi:S1C family serine protease [Bavariicoccus seileri]|uniref:S1C family serine protease n=1 Tax=Bavariicoccus seileri TaxID=549685 RepID=UPI003F93BA91